MCESDLLLKVCCGRSTRYKVACENIDVCCAEIVQCAYAYNWLWDFNALKHLKKHLNSVRSYMRASAQSHSNDFDIRLFWNRIANSLMQEND